MLSLSQVIQILLYDQSLHMSKNIHVIYIPGLGDGKPRGQNLAIKLFRLFGIKAHYFTFGWANSDTFEDKLSKLLILIDELHNKGAKVHLFAASAGASAALNAFSKRQAEISSVSLVCGKVGNLNGINPSYFKKNPNFGTSIKMLTLGLSSLKEADRAKIMSIRPLRDSVVPPKDTIIEGAKNIKSFTFGHSTTIAHYLTVGLPRIVWWIRKN